MKRTSTVVQPTERDMVFRSRPPAAADARDIAEWRDKRRQMAKTIRTLRQHTCRDGARPPIPDDFRLTDETWLVELLAFGLPQRTINSLEKAKVFDVGDARLWLDGGAKVDQIDVRGREQLRAAIAAAERWTSGQTG